MATNSLPSRFANPLPARRVVAEPVEDFAMISLESVESMLRESDNAAAFAPPPGNSYIPPPLFSSSAPEAVTSPPVAAPKPNIAATVPNAGGAARFRFADLLRADGTIDTDAVYRYAQIPVVPLSAELLLQALSNLPKGIPVAARRSAIQVTVGSLTSAAGIAVESVVADARLRHTRLEQFRDALLSEYAQDEAPICDAITAWEDEIAAKQAELAAMHADLAAVKAKRDAATRNCATLLGDLLEVVDCLAPAAVTAPPEAETDDAEEPSHLREDSVRRLLGIADDL